VRRDGASPVRTLQFVIDGFEHNRVLITRFGAVAEGSLYETRRALVGIDKMDHFVDGAICSLGEALHDKIHYRVRNDSPGRVVSRDLDSDVQALAYLVTVLIHRLHENDRAGWQEFRNEIRAARIAAPVGTVKDKVLQRAVGIVEDALKDHGDE